VRRISFIAFAVVCSIAATATAALAQYPPAKTPPTDPSAPPPVAFTGSGVSIGLIIVVALAIVGTGLLLAARRRRAPASK
jgi:hypothetical protein